MEKKYQVFISSTYSDFIEERKALFDVILSTDCIPAGMESFVATDDEQFEVIKRVIDLCDYYILLIGGRYGTINDKTGKSFTEMEYEYAISKNIPVLVFARNDIDSLPANKRENDNQKKTKLVIFKDKAMKNRLATVWSTLDDLKVKVAISIMNAKNQFSRPGWVRGDSIISQTTYLSIMDDNAKLKEENLKLKEELKQIKEELDEDSNEKFLEGKIKVRFTPTTYVIDGRNHYIDYEFTYKQIFKKICGALISMVDIHEFKKAINNLCPEDGFYLTSQEIQNTIKAVFVANKVLKCNSVQTKTGMSEMIGLTEYGFNIMKKIII